MVDIPDRDPELVLAEAAGHLAYLSTQAIYAEQPELWELGEHGRHHTHNDFVLHFGALAQGPDAFKAHMNYTQTLFRERGFPREWLSDALRIMKVVCSKHLEPRVATAALESLDAAEIAGGSDV